jgi:hypothetical protein
MGKVYFPLINMMYKRTNLKMENVLSNLKRQINCIQINLYLFMSDLRMQLSTQLNTNKLNSNKHLFIIVEASKSTTF